MKKIQRCRTDSNPRRPQTRLRLLLLTFRFRSNPKSYLPVTSPTRLLLRSEKGGDGLDSEGYLAGGSSGGDRRTGGRFGIHLRWGISFKVWILMANRGRLRFDSDEALCAMSWFRGRVRASRARRPELAAATDEWVSPCSPFYWTKFHSEALSWLLLLLLF